MNRIRLTPSGLLLGSLLLTSLLLLTSAAATDPDSDGPPPTFRAGAEVTLGCTVNAPENWVINPAIPFRVSFDAAALKTAPFTLVGKNPQDFKLKETDNHVYIELQVKLKKDLPDGEIKIPLQFECMVCMQDESQCSTTKGQLEAHVVVQNAPTPGAKDQALKRGTQSVDYRLPSPL